MLTPYKLYQFLDVSSGTGTPAPGFPPQPPAPRAVEVVQPFFFEWVRDIWESQKALAPDCKFDIHYTYIYIYIERDNPAKCWMQSAKKWDWMIDDRTSGKCVQVQFKAVCLRLHPFLGIPAFGLRLPLLGHPNIPNIHSHQNQNLTPTTTVKSLKKKVIQKGLKKKKTIELLNINFPHRFSDVFPYIRKHRKLPTSRLLCGHSHRLFGGLGQCQGLVTIWLLVCFYCHYKKSNNNWLVVWTPLKNISQLGLLFPIYGKIKNVPNHQPDKCCYGHHGLVLILTLTITALDCDCRQYHDWCIIVGSLVV